MWTSHGFGLVWLRSRRASGRTDVLDSTRLTLLELLVESERPDAEGELVQELRVAMRALQLEQLGQVAHAAVLAERKARLFRLEEQRQRGDDHLDRLVPRVAQLPRHLGHERLQVPVQHLHQGRKERRKRVGSGGVGVVSGQSANFTIRHHDSKRTAVPDVSLYTTCRAGPRTWKSCARMVAAVFLQ